jgi:PIN domain nuclease of toxin-antitoxin system
MRIILDTHFIIWVVGRSRRVEEFPWLKAYRPWGVSPISLLEIQYLAEIGRVEVSNPAFSDRLSSDRRFVIDETPLTGLIRQALSLSWTRDPFDRLLAAHSQLRRVPLCTTDRRIREHHAFLTAELGRIGA